MNTLSNDNDDIKIAHFLQVLPSVHHIIYLGTFYATFMRHPVFVLLKISVYNCQLHPLAKYTILLYFLFQHHTSPNILIFSVYSTTYSVKSAPKTMLTCFNTLSYQTDPCPAKNHFPHHPYFLILINTHGLTIFLIDSFTSFKQKKILKKKQKQTTK